MAIFEKLVNRIARAKGRVACPKCGAKQPFSLSGGVMTCASCGFRASTTEWSMSSLDTDSGRNADPDSPPAGTRIVRKEPAPGTVAWEIPPSGKSGGLLPFGILWTGFVCFWTFGALFASRSSDDPGGLLFPLFSLPFWAVGIGMLYFALRAKYSRHLLMLSPGTVVLARSLFRRNTKKSLDRDQLSSVQKKEFYKQNYTPVYGIEIRGPDGKLRFGTTLSEEEKDWLVADMNRLIWPGDRREPAPASSASTSTSASSPRTTASRQQSFEVEFPAVRVRGSTAGMIIGFLVVGGFLAIGIWVIKDAGFFRWIWLGLNSLFALGITAGAVSSWRNRNRIVRVRGDRSGIHVETLRGRVPIKDVCLHRDGPIEVRSFPSGRMNNTTMVRIELISADEVVPIVKWYPEDAAQEPVRQLESFLSQ